jgi:DNA adenine methylase
LVPILATYWNPGFKRYVEPFAGSAVLFAHLEPQHALLGDLNVHLISTYRTVRDDPESVFNVLSDFKRGVEAYRRIRSEFHTEGNRIRRAAQFIYLNRFCFNGLYRTNLKGEFNVPYGAHKSGSLPTLSQICAWSSRLKRSRLHAGDFERLLDRTQPGDFVYMDPPFAVRERRVFRQYDPKTFSGNDVQRLQKSLRKLDRRGVRFVVSYAECEEAQLLASGFDVRKIFVRRNIAGFAASRARAAELLISN